MSTEKITPENLYESAAQARGQAMADENETLRKRVAELERVLKPLLYMAEGIEAQRKAGEESVPQESLTADGRLRVLFYSLLLASRWSSPLDQPDAVHNVFAEFAVRLGWELPAHPARSGGSRQNFAQQLIALGALTARDLASHYASERAARVSR